MMLDIIRLLISGTVLMFAAYTDATAREVYVWNWYAFTGSGIVLLIIQLLSMEITLTTIIHLLMIPPLMAAGYLMWKTGMCREGDRDGIISMAILLPFPSSYSALKVPLMPWSYGAVANALIIMLVMSVILYIKKNKTTDMDRLFTEPMHFPFMVALSLGNLIAFAIGNVFFL
jgi:hypothetical protein